MTGADQKSGQIFISHARLDRDDVEQLCDEILHGGGSAPGWTGSG